jgi:hypothetical protein
MVMSRDVVEIIQRVAVKFLFKTCIYVGLGKCCDFSLSAKKCLMISPGSGGEVDQEPRRIL